MSWTRLRSSRAPFKIAAAAIVAGLCLAGGRARAEQADIVEGRLSLAVSYGFLARFFQDDRAANPDWGHGVFFRLIGERCGAVCYGLSVGGGVGVSPSATGSVTVGPHIGLRWEGPSWGGPYFFRAGAGYAWLATPSAEFTDDQMSLGDSQSAHGVNVWLSIGLELLGGNRWVTPIIGISGEYTAVVSTDPIEHDLSAQGTIGLTLGRRMVFGRTAEAEQAAQEEEGQVTEPEEGTSPGEEIELEEEEEQRLRDAEEQLRRSHSPIDDQQRLRRP